MSIVEKVELDREMACDIDLQGKFGKVPQFGESIPFSPSTKIEKFVKSKNRELGFSSKSDLDGWGNEK